MMLGVSFSRASLVGAAVRVEVCPSTDAGTEAWKVPREGVAVPPVVEGIPLRIETLREPSLSISTFDLQVICPSRCMPEVISSHVQLLLQSLEAIAPHSFLIQGC